MGVHDVLGANVRRLRKAAGLSQEAFADHACIHRNYVSDLERGRRNPTLDIIEKLAVALKVRVGSLLDDPACHDEH